MYVTSPNSFSSLNGIHAAQYLENEVFENTPVRSIKAGEVLFYERDEAGCVYEILEGVARSSKVLFNGRRQIVSFGYPSDLLGVSHDGEYHCDCEALTDMKIRVHHKNVCSADLTSDLAFYEVLMKQMALEVNGMQEHFMMLGRKTAEEKVASFLLVLLEKVGDKADREFKLPMSRVDIADFLGLTIETVSRTLSKFRKLGIISLPESHRVRVNKPNTLGELAELND